MSEQKNLIHEPNTTQVPNVILDYWISKLNEMELKVLISICRKTFGWHKKKDKISISQLSEMTGKNTKSVREAVHRLVKYKLIHRSTHKTKSGNNNPNCYEINMIYLNKKEDLVRGTPRKRRRGEGYSAPAEEVLRPGGDTKPTMPKPKALEGNAPLPPIVHNSDSEEGIEKAVPFSMNEKKEEEGQKVIPLSGGRKFPRTREKESLYQWLRSLGLDTNEDTLSVWANDYDRKKLEDSWSHLKWKISNGFKAKSMGAVFITLVKTEHNPVTSECLANQKTAEDFKKETRWNSLVLRDKFCFCEANPYQDIPYRMNSIDFANTLIKLWELKTGRSYYETDFSKDYKDEHFEQRSEREYATESY